MFAIVRLRRPLLAVSVFLIVAGLLPSPAEAQNRGDDSFGEIELQRGITLTRSGKSKCSDVNSRRQTVHETESERFRRSE
jgi:hypothetical protein